jgi:tetratricopeptide (TPR) repeat protein
MSKNVLLCVLGVVLGFVVGFFIANSITRPGMQVAAARSSSTASSDGAAGPLKPDQMSGELPPGHPNVGTDGDAAEADGSPSTAASTSAEAQTAMDKADRSPKDFQAQFDAGKTFYQHQDYGKATLYLTRALAIKSNDFDALALAGNAKYDDKDFAGAATFYERALAVRPNSPDVRTDLGNTYFNRKEFDRAIAEYRKSIALAPDHLNSWKNIAAAAFQKGDKATATEAVETLSALAPGSEEIEALRQQLAQMP